MDWLSGLFSSLWGYFNTALTWLRHLKFADIWNAIKRGYDRFQQALAWYQKHILQPWERLRQNLIALYNRIFGPFIKLLDTVRATVRVLSLFDKALAAKIDAALWKIESDLYAPLYAALKNINAVVSTLRAIVTAAGLLDRGLMIQSLERDWKSVWRVLLNNGQLPSDITAPAAGTGMHQVQIDFDQFVANGSGPFADSNDQLQTVYNNVLEDLI